MTSPSINLDDLIVPKGTKTAAILLQGPKGVFVLYDYVTSLLAVIVNVIALLSVIKARINLTGYKFFLVSLGFSNLYLCCVNISMFGIEAAARLYGLNSVCLTRVFRSLQMTGFIANLLNLSGMSFDHLLGIVYPFAYDRVMRKCMMRILLTALWTVAVLLGSAELPMTTFFYFSSQPGVGSNDAMALRDDFSQSESTQDTPIMKQLLTETNCSVDNFMMASSPRDYLTSGTGNNNATLMQAMNLLQLGIVDDKMLITMLQQEIEEAGAVSVPSMTIDEDGASSSFVTSVATNTEQIELPNPLDVVGSNKQQRKPIDQSCLLQTFLNALGQVANKAETSVKMMQESQQIPVGIMGNGWCDFYRSVPFLEYAIMGLTILCFVFVAICYGQIFKEIFFKRDGPKRSVRRLVMTTFMLLSAFSICYLPFMTFELLMVLAMHFDWSGGLSKASWANFMIAHNVFNSMLITSPLLQPLLYVGRLSIVRRQIMRDLKEIAARCWPFDKTCIKLGRLRGASSASAAFALSPFTTNFDRYESGARRLCGRPSTTITAIPRIIQKKEDQQ